MRIFGAPLDVPNSPERLNLKLAYVFQVINFPGNLSRRLYDPYDVICADLGAEFGLPGENAWIGKMPVDSWLTPRPQPSDLPLLTTKECDSFLERNGCWDYSLKVAEFVEKTVFPYKPVMIGVDHSLTGGVLLSLAKENDDLNVIIIDAHFDVMKFGGWVSASTFKEGRRGWKGKSMNEEKPFFYHCGNFLSRILEKEIVHPENLWILGVQEEVLAENNERYQENSFSNDAREVKRWIDKGVHLLSKKDVTSETMSISLNGPTYISIDMDVGSLSSVFSARFMNCYGVSFEEFLHLLSRVATSIREADVPILGFDIMEIDVHFLEVVQGLFHDHTRRIVREIFRSFFAGCSL